jgi:hypothetical protein
MSSVTSTSIFAQVVQGPERVDRGENAEDFVALADDH